MIVRLVLLRFEGNPDVAAICDEARRVFPAIPHVTGFRCGTPADHEDWHLMLEVEFAQLEHVDAYRAHPIHTDFVDTWLKPHLGDLVARNYVV